MDFAPYQDNPPETNRCLSSKAITSPSSHPDDFTPTIPYSENVSVKPWMPYTHPPENIHDHETSEDDFTGRPVFGTAEGESGRDQLNEFETSLSIRLDYEACLAYLLLPPAGGVFLLLIEQKSDYVRFHAWQSSMLFSAIFIFYLLISWSGMLSLIVFLGSLSLAGYLTLRAYRDANTLDRYEVPFFGQLASRMLDDE